MNNPSYLFHLWVFIFAVPSFLCISAFGRGPNWILKLNPQQCGMMTPFKSTAQFILLLWLDDDYVCWGPPLRTNPSVVGLFSWVLFPCWTENLAKLLSFPPVLECWISTFLFPFCRWNIFWDDIHLGVLKPVSRLPWAWWIQ